MGRNREKPSFLRLYQLIVLMAWVVAFWFLLQHLAGRPIISKFLRPDYWWLVEVGTAILVFFVMALVYCDPAQGGRRCKLEECQNGPLQSVSGTVKAKIAERAPATKNCWLTIGS